MQAIEIDTPLEKQLRFLLRRDFEPRFNHPSGRYPSREKWQKLKTLGTRLWVDSGNIEQIKQVWTKEFDGLTVNNTLLNKEIQAGRYDDLIPKIIDLIEYYADLTDRQKLLEISFALNGYHGLRLVEKFDAYVSLEEHTDLANDVDLAVSYGRRLIKLCPERLCIKIPFTPAGLLATRILVREQVPINHTLGFSARQNYLIARIAKPTFVNVFLGRLNSFIESNDLGSGDYVGEKATLASQKAVRQLREKEVTRTWQIGASFRNGQQVHSLAGIDVMTMPPKVAREFDQMDITPQMVEDRTDRDYPEQIKKGIDPETIRLNTLWDIDQTLIDCVDALEQENLDSFTPDDLVDFFKDHDCGDVLVPWSDEQIRTSAAEGKIPKLENWADALKSRQIGLDSLMNLAGLNSFAADQQEMDEKVRTVLVKE